MEESNYGYTGVRAVRFECRDAAPGRLIRLAVIGNHHRYFQSSLHERLRNQCLLEFRAANAEARVLGRERRQIPESNEADVGLPQAGPDASGRIVHECRVSP
jgi:hypothetical protein